MQYPSDINAYGYALLRSQFIRQIHQEGYNNNDALLVKVCVIVLKSSVEINPQDAGIHFQGAGESSSPDGVMTCFELGFGQGKKLDSQIVLNTFCSLAVQEEQGQHFCRLTSVQE